MAKQVSVSLEKQDIKAVKDFGREIGIRPFSTALQAMIRQFQQMRAKLAEPSSAPVVAAGNDNGSAAPS